NVAVDPSNANIVYITFTDFNQPAGRIAGYKSTDGGLTWGSEFFIGDPISPPGYQQSSQPRVASNGWIYVGYQEYNDENAGCAAGVRNEVARSTDGGATWSAPVKINSDPDGANKDQYYPWMSVLPNGQIWVGWNDRRDDANDFLSKWYQAHSNDEGTTWLDINGAPGNDVVADVQTQPSTFIGDYHGLGAGGQGNGNVLGMWFDSRNSPSGD